MKCPNCPLLNRPESCPAIERRHAPFCWYMDPDDPEYTPVFGPIIVAMATNDPPPPEARPVAAIADAEVRARMAVETCDFLSGCHCGGNARCLIGAYPAPTSWPVCLACVATSGAF